MNWNTLSPLDKAHLLEDAAAQAGQEGLDQVAYTRYAQALDLYRELDDRVNIVRMLIRISYLAGWADFHDGLDMFTRKQLLADEALPMAHEVGDQKLLAVALCAFSVSTANPMATLEESLTLARASGDKPTLAMVLSSMGNQLAVQRDQTRSEAVQREALELYQDLGDKAGTARLLFSMAIRADKAQKRVYLEQALELQRELGSKKRIYEILTLLDSFCDPVDLDQHEAYNLEALDLARQFGSAVWQASRLNRLAEIATSRGDFAKATLLKTESVSIYREPEIDPGLEDAFAASLESGDVHKIQEAFKNLTHKEGALTNEGSDGSMPQAGEEQ